jgi:hypothetical protein
VQNHTHHAARGLGVTVRDGDRGFLVQAEQHLWPLIAEVIDDAVVEAPVARAGVEREIRNVERAQHRGDRIASPDFRGRRNPDWAFTHL